MMKMDHVTENPPSKIARLSSYDPAADSGFGLLTLHDSSWNTTDGLINNGEGSPPIQLGLELRCGAAGGGGSGSSHSNNKLISSLLPAKPVTGGFTFLQIQELRQQTEIYKFIRAGLPVPHHLVFPIWKSVVCSLADVNKQSPYFPRIPGQFYLDYKGSMDPEPGRCRRTDGKKWRCSKEAIADQKYCERHMHRGKQRSRKQRDLLAAAESSSTSLSISLETNNNSNSSRNINVAPRLVDFSASRILLHSGSSSKD